MIRQFTLFLALVASLVSGASSVWAGVNSHEHFTSIADYSDYVYAFEKIGKPLDKAKGEILFENLGSYMNHVFGITLTDRQIAYFKKRSFDELARFVRNSRRPRPKLDLVKRSFFEFTELNKRTAHTVHGMEAIGWNLRTEAQKFLALHTDSERVSSSGSDGDSLETKERSGLYHLFDHYLIRNPNLSDREILTLSIGASNFAYDPSKPEGDPEGKRRIAAMKDVHDVFLKHETGVEFFVVWQRNAMITDAAKGDTKKFDALMDALEAMGTPREGLKLEGNPFVIAAKEGLIHGIDLVGSLHEGHDLQTKFDVSSKGLADPASFEVTRESVRRQMRRLMHIALNDPKLQLKFHAWEKPEQAHAHGEGHSHSHRPSEAEIKTSIYEGEFYKVFTETLSEELRAAHAREKARGSPTKTSAARVERYVRIGHIGGFDPTRDMQFFADLQKATHTQFIFEANIQSSHDNHGVSPQKMVQNIRALQKAGFSVVLGTDGVGIMTPRPGVKDIHFTSQLAELRKIATESEFERIGKWFLSGGRWSRSARLSQTEVDVMIATIESDSNRFMRWSDGSPRHGLDSPRRVPRSRSGSKSPTSLRGSPFTLDRSSSGSPQVSKSKGLAPSSSSEGTPPAQRSAHEEQKVRLGELFQHPLYMRKAQEHGGGPHSGRSGF